jgi:hypothetical protein
MTTRAILRISAVAAAALSALSGCDSVGGLPFMDNVSAVGQVSANYRESDYGAAGRGRDMWVVIVGSVPGADAATLQQQTLAALQRHAGIPTRFTATPQNHKREYKTVIVYNGPSNLQAGALCRNPSQPAAVANRELRMQAVFCRDDEYLSEVYSRVPGGNSLSNPNFEALVRQTMTELYTARREQQLNEPRD